MLQLLHDKRPKGPSVLAREVHVEDGEVRVAALSVVRFRKRERAEEENEDDSGPIEDKKPKRRAICHKGGMRVGRHKDGQTVAFARSACHQWRCPVCGPDMTRLFACRLKRFIEENGTTEFFTFTFAPAKWLGLGWVKWVGKRRWADGRVTDRYEFVRGHDRDMWHEAARIWDRFLKRVKRRLGLAELRFVLVNERHSSGLPHLHVLIQPLGVDMRWILDAWDECGGGSSDHAVVRVALGGGAGHAANYLAKYLSKQMAANEVGHAFDSEGTLRDGELSALEERLEAEGLKKLPLPKRIKHYRSVPKFELRKRGKGNPDMDWSRLAHGVKVHRKGMARLSEDGTLQPLAEGWKVPDLRHDADEHEAWRIVALTFEEDTDEEVVCGSDSGGVDPDTSRRVGTSGTEP